MPYQATSALDISPTFTCLSLIGNKSPVTALVPVVTLNVAGDALISGGLQAGTLMAGNLIGNVFGNLTGDVTGDVTGNVTGDVTGNLFGNVYGDLCGNVYSDFIFEKTPLAGTNINDVLIQNGLVIGNLTGNIIGDTVITGNLTVQGNTTTIESVMQVTQDPNLLLAKDNTGDLWDIGFIGKYNDGVDKFTGLVRDHTVPKWKLITNLTALPTETTNFGLATYADFCAGNITGTFFGNVTGNLTGKVTGDVTGNLTGKVTGDVTGNLTGNVTGNVTGQLTGNVTGNVTGDVTGNIYTDNIFEKTSNAGITLQNKIFVPTAGGGPIAGIATLVAGTVTVATTKVTASSVILISRNTAGGTIGDLRVPSASIIAGTSFVINASAATDTSTVNWLILN